VILTPKTEQEIAQALSLFRQKGVFIHPSAAVRILGHSNTRGIINAVVAYDSFCGRTCFMHVAAEGRNWISKKLLHAAFHYPFIVCDFVTIFGGVADDNEEAMRMNKHLGFRVIKTIRHGWSADVDLHVMEMTREECKWIRGKFAQRSGLMAS